LTNLHLEIRVLGYFEGDSLTPLVKISPKVKRSILGVTICVWFAEALAAKEPLNPDAVSYLNIANSLVAGNWHAIVNGYWSPVFPLLLSLMLKIVRPSPFHQPLAVHMFAFVSLIAALFSFEYFLSEFFSYRRHLFTEQFEVAREEISDDAIWLIGYSLFFWITSFLTPPYLEQPDILVFVLYLLASAICMQLSSRQEWWRFALLGLVLGLGYLVKAVMFPLGFVFLLAVFWQRAQWRVLLRLVLSTAAFVAVSLPFCLALSHSKGRFTFGDVGIIAYRQIMGLGDETLPPTSIPRPVATPHIQDYSQILQLGTYPPWADPSYRFKGAPFQFSFWRQVNRTHVVLHDYFNLYVEKLGVLMCGLLVLFSCSNPPIFAKRFLRQIVLWLPAIAGLAFYATMRVEGRFLAGYTIGLFAACIASIRIAEFPGASKLICSAALAVSLLLSVQAAVQAGHEAIELFDHAQPPDQQVAATLLQMGVEVGDRVSYMGDTLVDHSWAYLAGVKIVSEIPQEDVLSFWAADQIRRTEVLNWLASTGAKVLVTQNVPDTAMPMGWRRVGNSDYYILPLLEQQ
jgi:hypothetical protein